MIMMHDPQSQLLREIKQPGITQASVAISYAFLIVQEGDNADWPRVNAAIKTRWVGSSALVRVKTMAWKHVDSWRRAASVQSLESPTGTAATVQGEAK